jgi:hypothetical protein
VIIIKFRRNIKIKRKWLSKQGMNFTNEWWCLFGISNAPCNVMRLMNYIFKIFIWNFAAIYFDGILTYNNKNKEHLEHMYQILNVLR